jgi:hypothetical protein
MKRTNFILVLCILWAAGCQFTPPVESTDPAETLTESVPPETAVTPVTPTSRPSRQPTRTITATATILMPTHTPTATPPRLSAATVPPSPTPRSTSDILAGWWLYENNFYDYHFSYPPEAPISTQGVTGFPTDELPENMTSENYRRQLAANYPNDICVNVQYKLGFVTFKPSEEAGGKYSGPCGVTGVGAYDVQAITETVMIDQYPYIARGWLVSERNEAATWHSQFYFITLGDGTAIHFGSFRGSQQEFMEIKETLLQIVTSFRSAATSLPVVTPTPAQS